MFSYFCQLISVLELEARLDKINSFGTGIGIPPSSKSIGKNSPDSCSTTSTFIQKIFKETSKILEEKLENVNQN